MCVTPRFWWKGGSSPTKKMSLGWPTPITANKWRRELPKGSCGIATPCWGKKRRSPWICHSDEYRLHGGVQITFPMNRKFFITAVIFLAGFSLAWADRAIESAQQKLKDQGFYYGEINGKKDADTTAAIRRYQIRNGLQITGELDSETQRSLGVASTTTPAPTRPSATPDTSDLRAESSVPKSERTDVPGPRGPRPETSGLFDGTPYEVAPPEVQRRVIVDAQT